MSFFSKGKQTEYSRLLFTYIIPAMVQGMSIFKFAVLRYGSEVLFYASWYIAKLNNKTLGVCFIFMRNWAMKLTFIYHRQRKQNQLFIQNGLKKRGAFPDWSMNLNDLTATTGALG